MNDLQPPGKGLPAFERVMLKTMLKTAIVAVSPMRALRMFRAEAEEILRLVDDVDYGFASQRILVPRYQGMEDSSRNWSLFMVLEHLIRVDSEILSLMNYLVQGIVPHGEIDIANYKPDEDCGAETIDGFVALIDRYSEFIEHNKAILRGTLSFAHPWFGDLRAHGWHCLAAVHHRVHRKQARKIAAMIGQA